MNIPAMCTGEMKYVILRIDTHVLRIDLCPRKRTRIRRQKQDEDVHLFLSERPLPRGVCGRPLPRGVYGRRRIWPGASADAGEAGRVPAPSSVRVGAYRIRPPNIPQGMNEHTRGRVFATDGGARWGVCCCASYTGTRLNISTGAQPPTNQHQTGPQARMDGRRI